MWLDFVEFITAMGILSKGGIEEKLKLAFDIYDFNDDGFIEKKEAEKIVHVNSFLVLFIYLFCSFNHENSKIVLIVIVIF